MKLEIVKGLTPADDPAPGWIRVRAQTVAGWLAGGQIFRHLFRYKSVNIRVARLDADPRPFLTSAAARLLSHGRAEISDSAGRIERISWIVVLRNAGRALWARLRRGRVILKVTNRLTDLEADVAKPSLQKGKALYLRPDLWYGVGAGGSIGHIAGVFRHLNLGAHGPLMITTELNPLLGPGAGIEVFTPPSGFWDQLEIPELESNLHFPEQALKHAEGHEIAFVYHRLAIHSYAAVEVARRLMVPLVLEYNGSEVWVRDNWGVGVRFRKLARRIEDLNMERADLIVTVSRPLRDDLQSRGISPDKILVVPNGVEPGIFHPRIDGSEVRREMKIPEEAVVVGFIGTFGPWHGAQDLAKAVSMAMDSTKTIHALWIGDGDGLNEVRALVKNHPDRNHFTGLVPQRDAPIHLAACDILVSPQVPNADGSEFFGSPTKLFEYLAMGKAVVATAVGQNKEIIRDEQSGLLVAPGDRTSLKAAIERLANDSLLRSNLGTNARRQAEEEHTWEHHTRQILAKLRELTA